MNINKIVKDSVNGIKDKYNNTQLNPFKMPENINVTITIDYEKSVSNLFKALGSFVSEITYPSTISTLPMYFGVCIIVIFSILCVKA